MTAKTVLGNPRLMKAAAILSTFKENSQPQWGDTLDGTSKSSSRISAAT